MIQRHSIILWRKAEPEDKSFDEVSKEAYEILNLFQSYPQELRPNYLTAKTKEDIQKFDWNYKNFCEQLKRGINKEGNVVFEELGYSISFFSSMDELKSCAFLMTAGNKFEKLNNVLVVDLPLSLNLYDKNTANIISDLFGKLVQMYKPFWGCVSNKALSRKYGKFLERNVPTTIHWMNFWSEDILDVIGKEKLQSVVMRNPEVVFRNNILQIKNTAINVELQSDMEYHNELHKQILV